MIEEWKDIKDYEGLYQISNFGKIKSLKLNRIRRIQTNTYGYPIINLSIKGIRKTFFMHRLIYESFIGEIKKGYEVDHKDCDKNNNDISNLRLTTRKQNNMNKKISKICKTSKYKGVFLSSTSTLNKWICQIKINYRSKYIGCYPDETEAAKSYDEAALKYHGEYAMTNKMMGLL